MGETGGHGVEVEALLEDLADVMTHAATRIHAEHRRRATAWVAAASLLGLAGIPLLSRHHHVPAAGIAAGMVGALAKAGRHLRLAGLSRPD